jgi:hypothetical protein
MTILFNFIYFLHIDVKNSTVLEIGKTQFVKTNILSMYSKISIAKMVW